MMDISIRDATAEDSAFLAWVQLEATRSNRPLGFWDLALPGPEAPRLALIAEVIRSERQHFGSYSGFVVAEHAGAPVAALSGYDVADKPLGRFVGALFGALEGAGWNQAHRDLVPGRIAPAIACMSDSPEDCWIVEWVAATPEARGKGVAQRLLQHILDRGRALSYRRAQISHLIDNTPAERAYARAGFVRVSEKRDPGFEAIFGAPGVACMQMDL